MVRLLAEDGLLQALLSQSPSDIGRMAMMGDLLLQGGMHPDRGGRKSSTAMDVDGNGVPDYGSLAVVLRPNDVLMQMLSPSIWFFRNDASHQGYLRECLHVAIERHPILAGAGAGVKPGKIHGKRREDLHD